jgi:thiol:disulfide interchange protein DsbC
MRSATFGLLLPALLLALISPAAVADERSRVIEGLRAVLPNIDISKDQIEPSPIAGLWTVTLGPEVVYVDGKGVHLIQGELIHLPSRSNLTENVRAGARKAALGKEPDGVVFSGSEVRHNVTVFTDIDCGYCRQLHRDMQSLNNRGIAVRYLFYPRGGEGAPAWKKSDKVWCARDRREAMDVAKAGREPESPVCEETPTERHYRLGQQMGVTGTPTIVTESGHLIRGYLPAERLVSEIEKLENR